MLRWRRRNRRNWRQRRFHRLWLRWMLRLRLGLNWHRLDRLCLLRLCLRLRLHQHHLNGLDLMDLLQWHCLNRLRLLLQLMQISNLLPHRPHFACPRLHI